MQETHMKLRVIVLAGALGAMTFAAKAASAAQSLEGVTGYSDLFWPAGEGPEHLFDGDTSTHFLLYRVLDAEWRVQFRQPTRLASVTLVQGYDNWSTAQELVLESADGSEVTLPLKVGSREPQTFTLDFPGPTSFVDVRVSKATQAEDGGDFGGLAELQFAGEPTDAETDPPVVSHIVVSKPSATQATVAFETDEPATCRLRYSEQELISALTPVEAAMATHHSLELSTTSPLGGQVEIRCADAAGNRAEVVHDAFSTLETTRFQWGMGGWAFQFDGKWVEASERFAQDELPVDFAQVWIGDNDWRGYVTAEDMAAKVRAGLLPEIIHFYFGYVTQKDVAEKREGYLKNVRELAAVIAESGVGERVLVTLEPEYNQGDVVAWDGWNDLMIEAIDILHEEAGAKVGLLPGPWDLEHQVPISMGRAAAHADFVALQSMAGSVTNTREEMKTRVEESLRFTHYLHRRFLRPVRLGYLMISDYGGWAGVQRDVMIEYCERLPELRAAGLVSLSWMGYVDSPGADGALGEAEAHKGLRYVTGDAKPAFWVFQECVKHGASWLQTGEDPPGRIPAKDGFLGCSCEAGPGARSAGVPLGVALALGVKLASRRNGSRRSRRGAVP